MNELIRDVQPSLTLDDGYYNDNFYMKPILGEITRAGVFFLISPIDKATVTLTVDDIIYNIYHVEELTTLFIEFRKPRGHTFTWLCGSRILSSHTIKSKNKKLVFVSCDLPVADTHTSLWNKVEADICFHLGSNIYGDKAYITPPHDYDSIYYETWSRWAALLENTSHMFILDDHDIVEDYDYKWNKILPVRVGLEAYEKFLGSGTIIKRVSKSTTVYCISRTLNNMLDELDELVPSFTGNIILAVSSAPVPVPSCIRDGTYVTMFGPPDWDDETLNSLYNTCFSLLESKQVESITLIGSGIHIGIDGAITNGNHTIHVYVSSPITSAPTPIEIMYADGLNRLETFGQYSITLNAKAKRNFLTIRLPLNKSSPGKLTYSQEVAPKNLIKYYDEIYKMSVHEL